MRKSNLFLAALSVATCFLVSPGCEKKTDGDLCPDFKPTASTPVESGQSIQLTAPDLNNVESYFWTGPAGFESNDMNPTIDNAKAFNAGRYKLQVKIINGCRQSVETDSVIVNTPPSPCNPTSNTAELAGYSMSFYAVSGSTRGGTYTFVANGSQGDLTLEFYGTERPVAGIYDIESLGSDFKPGVVRVSFRSMSANWPASSGKVYVTVTNNKITATFCNVPVSNQTFGFSSNASGRLTEK